MASVNLMNGGDNIPPVLLRLVLPKLLASWEWKCGMDGVRGLVELAIDETPDEAEKTELRDACVGMTNAPVWTLFEGMQYDAGKDVSVDQWVFSLRETTTDEERAKAAADRATVGQSTWNFLTCVATLIRNRHQGEGPRETWRGFGDDLGVRVLAAIVRAAGLPAGDAQVRHLFEKQRQNDAVLPQGV